MAGYLYVTVEMKGTLNTKPHLHITEHYIILLLYLRWPNTHGSQKEHLSRSRDNGLNQKWGKRTQSQGLINPKSRGPWVLASFQKRFQAFHRLGTAWSLDQPSSGWGLWNRNSIESRFHVTAERAVSTVTDAGTSLPLIRAVMDSMGYN